MPRQLVSFDTDHIKEYLFATSTLSDIREASGLLDRLNNRRDRDDDEGWDTADAIQQVYPDFDRTDPEQCVYAAGGSAMVLLPDEQTARRAIRAVERLYRRETVIASITGVAVPTSDQEPKRFGQKARQAGHRLRKRKAEKGRSRTVPVAPYMHFCDACAQHPAAYQVEGELICRACRIKRPAAGEARRGLWEKLIVVTEAAPDNTPGEWEDLLKETLGSNEHHQHRRPTDFGDIGSAARRPGYIALIYADGNSMGRILEDLPSPRAYGDFSTKVDDLLLRVTYRALMKQVRQRPDKPLFEILMAGGDDLMLVTTSDIAFQVTLDLMQDFETYSAPLVHPYGVLRLSLGTGLVIAHDHFPIAAMQELATALQKRAKRRSFETGGGGTVDFMVVTAAGSESLDRIRDRDLTHEGFAFPPADDRAYRLTQRPYTLSELSALLECGREIKASGFPSSQLQAMYDALFHSPVQASLSAIQTLGRVRKDHKKVLWDFFRQFAVQSARTLPPWRDRDDDDRDSALGDLVEIYPFV